MRSQPHNFEVEGYFHQNQHQFKDNQLKITNNIDQPNDTFQPDTFEIFINTQQTRQMQQQSFQRQNSAPPNSNTQSQNYTNTHSYQIEFMRNETSLPYHLQLHEIKKNQLTIFTQKPNAAESF